MLRILLAIVTTIVVWEFVRRAAWKALRGRWEHSIGEWMRRHDVRLEHFRFVDRLWVRQSLLQDAELDKAAAERATETGTTIGEVRARMETWLDEIVPVFNVFSYYKLGGNVATGAVRICYELVFDHEGLAAARRAIPAGSVTVYVANHRSNADYVVLSVGAMKQVALSYAVGEWARVWPLDSLFRSFGSYFVRRGEKDPLYHRVLSRYLQLVASRGLTTAFFLEGALSRDGAFRVPKIGLLDYLVGILRDDPDRAITFVPVGLNFDRVLEDRTLTSETAGAPPPRALEKFRSLGRIVSAAPRFLLGVFGPGWLAAHRRNGYAAVSFGPTVSLSELVEDPAAMVRLPRAERLDAIAEVADALLARVATVVPATPVVLTCRALDRGHTRAAAIRAAVRDELRELRAAGRPIAQGAAFESVRRARADEKDTAAEMDREIVDADEADRTVDLAMALLERRGLVRGVGDVATVDPRAWALIRYYARSLDAPETLARRAVG